MLTVQDKTKLDALLLQEEEEDFDPISFYIIKTEGATQKLITVKNDDIILKGKFASPTDCKFNTDAFSETFKHLQYLSIEKAIFGKFNGDIQLERT